MITEDYVSFETAKLLKEKGYKGSFNGYYNNAGCVVDRPNALLKEPEYQYYERVSLYMAMKWLREVHNIHIYTFYANGWIFAILDLETGEEFTRRQGYSSEEAVEAAIKYCLTNLIK